MPLVLLGRGIRVGTVQRLDRLLQNRLHPRPSLLPQPSGGPDNRVGGPVAVSEDALVEQVDVHGTALVGHATTHASDADRCGPVA